MPPLLTYLLTGLCATVFGIALAGLISSAGLAPAMVFLNLCVLAAFVLAVDSIVSEKGVRASLRNAKPFARWVSGAVLGLLVATNIAIILFLILFQWLADLGGAVARGLLASHAASGFAAPGAWMYLIPVPVFALLLLSLLLVDFAASRTGWWLRVRTALAEDARARTGLVGLALFLMLILASLLNRQYHFAISLLAIPVVCLLVLLLERMLTNSRIWAVARHMIAEAIRMKIALVFIAIIALVLPVLPFTVAGDGLTLKSQVQSFLAYSLGITGFLLSVLTVFLACAALSNEIRYRHIFMVASKPLPRWQFFAGKWLGIATLNAALLGMTGVAVWGFTLYLKSRPTTVPGDREALVAEVLNARHGIRPQEPNWEQVVEDRLRQLREEGQLEQIPLSGRRTMRENILSEAQTNWRTLRGGQVRDYVFPGLLVNREGEGWLHLHFKPISSAGVDDAMLRAVWQAGDRSEINTLMPMQEDEFIVGRFHSIPIPVQAVNARGELHLRMFNASPRVGVTFEGAESFELLFDVGSFGGNLARALIVIWCRLAFLAVVGLLASSFLSFPVACMACMLVLLVASMSGFLTEAIDWAGPRATGDDPLWVLGPLLRPLGQAFLWLVPDFSKFDPVGNVVGGRNVPLMWVLQSLIVLVFIKGLILGLVGSLVLTKRELAQVTV
jgi:hypothetical protein